MTRGSYVYKSLLFEGRPFLADSHPGLTLDCSGIGVTALVLDLRSVAIAPKSIERDSDSQPRGVRNSRRLFCGWEVNA